MQHKMRVVKELKSAFEISFVAFLISLNRFWVSCTEPMLRVYPNDDQECGAALSLNQP